MSTEIEEKRNSLNLEIRSLLAVIDYINGVTDKYDDYESNTLNETIFLDKQIELVKEAQEKLLSIFK